MNKNMLGAGWIALCLSVITSFVASGIIAQESSLSPPESPIVLHVSERLMASAPERSFAFDTVGLESLGTIDIRTETPWSEGAVTFTGVRLRDILNAVRARGSAVVATALND